MKAILLLLSVFLPSGRAPAQDLTRYYTSNMQPAGILYFILPQTSFTNPATGTDLKMDVTYLEPKDSATVNFTYSDPESFTLSSVSIGYRDWKYRSPVKRIYVEIDKENRWVYRYTFAIPFPQLELFYRSEEPVITLMAGVKTITLRPIKKQWEKNSDISDRIIRMIRKNKS